MRSLPETSDAAPPRLPVTLDASEPSPIGSLPDALRARIETSVRSVGGVLLRDFRVTTPLEFRRFAASFGTPLASYEFGSTPRTRVLAGVYSSTEYPAHQEIPLHNEQSYARVWPHRIWFHCMKAAASGGETPLADAGQVYESLPRELRERWTEKQILYLRSYGAGIDVPWQAVFGTDDRARVEQYCVEHEIEWEWVGDSELRTRQRCPAVLEHPETGERVWFNQAHLFHVSALDPGLRATLLDSLGEDRLPRNACFGDGTPIPDADLEAVRKAYDQATVTFPWRDGDLLMLDNLRVAHGRRPFDGDRKVIVAMA